MWRCAVVVLTAGLLAGCIVVPKTKVAEVRSRTSTEPVAGEAGPVAIVVRASSSSVSVRARRQRTCTHEEREVVVRTRSSELDVAVPAMRDPRDLLALAILAPITIPISMAVSGVVVGVQDGRTTTTAKPIRRVTAPCPIAVPGLAVTITFPSGESVLGATVADGTLVVPIPANEPDRGVVTARSGNLAARDEYRRRHARPPADAPRVDVLPHAIAEAIADCTSRELVHGTLDVTFEIGDDGRSRSIDVDRGSAALAPCIAARLATTPFPPDLRRRTIVSRIVLQ